VAIKPYVKERAMQDREMQGGGGKPSKKHKAVMGRVWRALGEGQDFKSVKGYERLPDKARATLEGLKPEERELLSRTHQDLADAGLYEDVEDEHGGASVSFF
jgi:hypothetical protein